MQNFFHLLRKVFATSAQSNISSTFFVGVTANATAIVGASYTIGIAGQVVNGKLVTTGQHSYTGDPINSPHAGILDIGAGIVAQITDAPSLKTLENYTTISGLSGGGLVYLGGDIVSIEAPSGKTYSGGQFQFGAGLGADGHVMVPTTKNFTDNEVADFINKVFPIGIPRLP